METAPRNHGGTDAPVAGRIAPSENTLEAMLAEWEAHLRGRRCSPNSVSAMLGEVRRAARERGWVGPASFSFREIVGYLDAQTQWAASTYNRNLSVYRSLCRWLVQCGLLPSDPLRDAQRADGAGGPGARAATTDEARAIIRAAWLREQTDGRARRAPRSLYYACLFLSGARFGEPARWRWADLILDEDPASILWNDQNQKSNRRDEIVICPELAALLRAWRICAHDAHTGAYTPDSPVFPVAPHKRSWADDRARAGLARNDSRGRPLTAHSARKWYKTELVRAGVHADLIDRLMRHSAGVGSRYYDPTREEMAAAVGLLPRNLWPELIDPQRLTTLGPKSAGFALDSGSEIRPNESVRPMQNSTRQLANPRPPAGRIGLTSGEPAGTGLPALSGLNGAPGVPADGPRNGRFRDP